MNDTANLRKRMLSLWKEFDKGNLSAQDARTHIAFARTVLDTLKVEIAAAHLSTAIIPPVELNKTETMKRLAARH